MPMEGGKHWKESLIKTFRINFLLCARMTPSIPTASFYVYIIVWWRNVTKGYWWLCLCKGASVTVKQPSMLLNLCAVKIKKNCTIKNGIKAPKMANLYSRERIHYKTFTPGGKQKPAQNDHIWLVVILWRCFMRQPLVQVDHLWVVARVVVFYRFDCVFYFFMQFYITVHFWGVSFALVYLWPD